MCLTTFIYESLSGVELAIKGPCKKNKKDTTASEKYRKLQSFWIIITPEISSKVQEKILFHNIIVNNGLFLLHRLI